MQVISSLAIKLANLHKDWHLLGQPSAIFGINIWVYALHPVATKICIAQHFSLSLINIWVYALFLENLIMLIMKTVLNYLYCTQVAAATILFWKLECGNYSREETMYSFLNLEIGNCRKFKKLTQISIIYLINWIFAAETIHERKLLIIRQLPHLSKSHMLPNFSLNQWTNQ